MSEPLLLPYQSRWVEDRSPLKVGEKGHRIGLSWAEAYDMILYAGRGHGNVYYQSYAHDMTRGFIDDCAWWANQRLKSAVKAVGETLLDIDGEQIPAFRLPFTSGKEIQAVTSAPRAFRSKGRPGDIAIIDEAAFMDQLVEALKAALAFLTWGGKVHIISTHNGEGSAFNTLVRDIRDGQRPGSLHTIPFKKALAEGLYRRICRETGQTWSAQAEAEWEADIRAAYAEGAAEELDCIPSASGGAWLPWELIRSCEHPAAGVPDGYTGGLTYIGNDIGRRRDLWVAWVIELVGGVAWTREICALRNAPFAQQDDVLDELVERYRPVRVAMDQTGMGEKPVEDAKRRYGTNRVDGVILTAARKLDLATALKERYEDRTWRAPSDVALRNDLHSVRKQAGPTGTPRLVADDDQKESHADRFWAAALAAGAAATPAVKFDYRPVRRLNPDALDEDLVPPDRWRGYIGRAQLERGLP